MSFAQLGLPEMIGFGAFWAKMGDFLPFWCFSMKPAYARCDLRVVTTFISAEGVVDAVSSSVGVVR